MNGGRQGADWFFKRISSLTVSKTTAKIPIKMPKTLSENPTSAQLFRKADPPIYA
jgi:hypothetical protein